MLLNKTFAIVSYFAGLYLIRSIAIEDLDNILLLVFFLLGIAFVLTGAVIIYKIDKAQRKFIKIILGLSAVFLLYDYLF
jgi:hypothetical protein